MGDTLLKEASHFIPVHSLYLFLCRNNLFLKFSRHVAKRAAWDRLHQVRSINRGDSGPPDHHQDTCANRGISRILRS